jgi:hypothetical protein
MRISRAVVGAAAVLALLAFGCKQGGGNSGAQSKGQTAREAPDPPGKGPASFAKDVQPIFSKKCAHPSCHGVAKSAGLQLSDGEAYANTVDVPSSEMPSLMRIKPGEPDSSYLAMKIEGSQTVGARMPLTGGYLGDKQIAVIRSWIQAGAKKN